MSRCTWIACMAFVALGVAVHPPRFAAASVAVQQESLEELLRELDDREDDVRRRAVKKLVELGGEDAWEAVLGALGDESSQVADTVQLALPGVPAELRKELFGRAGLTSKNALVRERVAEALGRFEAAPIEALNDALGDLEAEVRRLAAWSVERLATAGRLEGSDPDALGDLSTTLEKLAAKDRDPMARGAALLAIAAWRTEGVRERALEGAEDKAPEMRSASLRALGALELGVEHEGAVARALGRGLDDERLGVRLAAVDGLGARGTRAAAGELIDALEVSEDEDLAQPALVRDAVVAALQAMSGLRHRADPRPWRAWWQELDEGWRASRERTREAGSDEQADTRARLVGLPIPEGSVAFLIDMSGSMWNADDDGRTMKELVDVELRRCLEALPTDTRFNVYPYATEPTAWEKKLVPASRRNVKRAVEDFVACRLHGKGNVWDAVSLALEDEGVESIVLFTDGAPTGGPHWDVDLVVDLLLERNRYLSTVFHCIVTEDKNGRLVRAWERLAKETGGRSIVVDVREVAQDE